VREDLVCTDKFGVPVALAQGRRHLDARRLDPDSASAFHRAEWAEQAHRAYDNGGAPSFWC
jgi:hypothetical protein